MDKSTALKFAEMIRGYWQEPNAYASLVIANEIITALEREIDYQTEREGWYSEYEAVVDGKEQR